jgi:hypothetical protein
MPYLIDGHNVIGQLPDLSLADPDDEAKLVLKLVGFAARHKTRCVVVFDKGITAGRSRMSTGTVEVIFAAPRSTADRIMIERINAARDPGYWVIVSNDREVLNRARARKMRAMRSAEFVRELAPIAVPGTAPVKPGRAGKASKSSDPGEAAHVHVSAAEVEMWLRLFRERDE